MPGEKGAEVSTALLECWSWLFVTLMHEPKPPVLCFLNGNFWSSFGYQVNLDVWEEVLNTPFRKMNNAICINNVWGPDTDTRR